MTSSSSIVQIKGSLPAPGAVAARTLALVLALALIPAGEALAQGLDEKAVHQASDTAFQEGKALAAAGQWGEACAKFDQSLRLLARGGTQQRLAHCLENIGKNVDAWYAFESSLDFARNDENKARQDFAHAHLKAIEAKLTLLVVRWAAPPPSAACFFVDGRLIEVRDDAPIALEPGVHTLRVAVDGHVRWEQPMVTTAGERRTIGLPVFESTVVARETPNEAPARASSPEARLVAGSGKSRSIALEPPVRAGNGLLRAVGWSTLGVGVGALGVGAFFGARAVSSKRQSDSQCPNGVCNDRGWELWNEGRSAARVTNVVLPAGGLCAAAGVALILLAPPAPRPSASARLRVNLSLTPDAAAFGVHGTW